MLYSSKTDCLYDLDLPRLYLINALSANSMAAFEKRWGEAAVVWLITKSTVICPLFECCLFPERLPLSWTIFRCLLSDQRFPFRIHAWWTVVNGESSGEWLNANSTVVPLLSSDLAFDLQNRLPYELVFGIASVGPSAKCYVSEFDGSVGFCRSFAVWKLKLGWKSNSLSSNGKKLFDCIALIG